VAKGRISAPGFFNDPAIRKAYSGAEWNGSAQLSLDPTKEVMAAKLRVDNGFSTRDKEAQELTGGDFFEIVQQRKREEILMREVRKIEQATE
jgi:capsid protein